ncbi:Tripartite motif-containing protein 16 [Nibea albiflora]|uniref:Tripartite motif-containing protein 16 n=1 Tax=Nibea albiflora TaxID=240163 RepID=A0ACB7EUY3_NIBAL|nr:Tripartite motif-containing protein 16 [Nibea albiflora]
MIQSPSPVGTATAWVASRTTGARTDPKGIYSCPQCRQTFCPKPSLSRNTMLAEAVEQLRKGAHKADVQQRQAVKSCLVCMSSYCEAHLKPHQTKKSLKQHELIAPTSNLAEKICTQHKKLLSEMQAENQQRLKDREQELKDMKKMMEVMKRSGERVHGDSEQVLSELMRSVERLQELLEEVLDQAGLEKMNQAQEVTDSLEAEIKELKKRDTEMKDLARCEDHIYYLQTCESMCSPLESGDLPPVVVNPEASFEPVREAILDLREKVEDLCNQELSKITKQVNDTTLFTLGDLFSGLASRNTNSRSPGIGLKSQDVRSRDTPRDRGNTSSPRLRDRQRREERETVRETNPRPSPRPSPTPSRRESQSLWSRSSQSQPAPAAAPAPTPSPIQATPAPAPAPAQATGGFSRMASISSLSSLFRSHRRGTTPATPVNNTPPAGGNPFNPGLFLDLPTPTTNHTAAFPALREINLDSIQAPEPRTREEFLQYSVPLTLDPNTAHRRLALSEGNTKATLQVTGQAYPDTPQRFDGWTQVMCQTPLYAQRCYWEAEWRGRGSSMGVAYGALNRKGSDARSGLGYNAQSWTLELSDTCCTAMHDNDKKDIPVTYSPRLGIYLDLSMGTLAFYSVAESMTHLHTFRANFTQPLYAAFAVGSGVGVGMDFALGQFSSSTDSIKLCPM